MVEQLDQLRVPSQTRYYDRDVDFDDLAKRDEAWAAICSRAKETKWIDFQEPQTLLQLTRSLLKCDFGISSLELPSDRLCPPVPVRWNYVHWIQQLLDTTSETYHEQYDEQRQVVGLDVGVGASAIYPLLACSTRPRWRMIGTDIDEHSLGYAEKNVTGNKLEQRIILRKSKASQPLIDLAALGIDELDFVMTNPPFYASETDMHESYGAKAAAPSAICTGSENEMICPGGDVGFVTRMVEESLALGERVQWYTAMLGKLSSLQQIVALLKAHRITNFAVTSLQAGYKTNRWAVAWSFRCLRPRNDVARHGSLVLGILPAPTAQTIAVPLMSAEWSGQKVDAALTGLDVKWQWQPSCHTGVMQASKNMWSRAARRAKHAAPATNSLQADSEVGGQSIALAVKITTQEGEVEVRWLRGADYVLFESFCGTLKRELHGR